MERNNLEGLFRDKLGGMVIEPSNEATGRFARKIQHHRRSIIIKRFSIAAIILLFLFAGMYSIGIFDTDRIDLSKGEFSGASFEPGIAILKDVPDPRGLNEDPVVQNEIALIKENFSTTSSAITTAGNPSPIAGENADIDISAGIENESFAVFDQENEELISGQTDENAYIEYFVADPDLVTNEQAEKDVLVGQERKPVKITIEYIASGQKDNPSDKKRGNFYSKLDNLKTMDEVLGDIRTYKDKLFALDFRKEEKVNNKEKSTE